MSRIKQPAVLHSTLTKSKPVPHRRCPLAWRAQAPGRPCSPQTSAASAADCVGTPRLALVRAAIRAAQLIKPTTSHNKSRNPLGAFSCFMQSSKCTAAQALPPTTHSHGERLDTLVMTSLTDHKSCSVQLHCVLTMGASSSSLPARAPEYSVPCSSARNSATGSAIVLKWSAHIVLHSSPATMRDP